MADTYAASDALAPRIRDGRAQSDADWFAELKADAQAWKPAGYDADQVERRHYYEGKITEILRAHMRRRFKLTADRMSLVESNWALLVAVNGAAVYDYPPARSLARDGKKIDPDAEEQTASPEDVKRAEDFADMVREAQLEIVMAEAERRTVLAKTSFIKVSSDAVRAVATGKPPITKVTSFWPCDVLVIPHPSNPASLATAVAVMLRVAGDGGCSDASTTWEVWTRDFTEDEGGNVTAFGPWAADKVVESTRKVRVGMAERFESNVDIKPIMWRTTDKKTTDVYPCPTLPIVEWHAGIADGCPFLDVGRNLVSTFNNVNADRSSEKFAMDMNAATPVIRKTDEPSPQNIAMGPGMLTSIRKDDDIQAIPVSADFAGMRGVAQAGLDEMALGERQSPSSYNAESNSTPTSGVALKIKNEAQSKARLEAIARAREVESRLLAVMAEVHDYWRGTSIVDDGISFVMDPQDPPEYEAKADTQKRAIDLLSAGLCSEVEARIMAGLSRTPEEARHALDQIAAEKKARPSQLGQQLNDLVNAPRFGKTPMPMDPNAEQQPKDPPPAG